MPSEVIVLEKCDQLESRKFKFVNLTKSVVLFFLTITTPTFASTLSCLEYYSADPTSITERFVKFHQARLGDNIIMTVDAFLQNETNLLFQNYEKELAKLELVGVNSPLGSYSQTFGIHLATLKKNATEIESLTGNPQGLTKLLSTIETRKTKLKEVSEEFAVCRSRADTCAKDLESAVSETGQSMGATEKLIGKFQEKNEELDQYLNYLSSDSVGSSGYGAEDAIQFVENKKQSINLIISNLKVLLENDRVFLIDALGKLRNDYPIMKQKIRDLIAAGAPKILMEMITSAPEKNSAPLTINNALNNNYKEIMNLIATSPNPKTLLSIVQDALSNTKTTFTIDETNAILEKIPQGQRGWGNRERWWTLKKSRIHKDITKEGYRVVKTGWFEAEAQIGWELLSRTQVTVQDSFEKRLKFKGLVNRLLATEWSGTNQRYKEALTRAFSRHWQRFL